MSDSVSAVEKRLQERRQRQLDEHFRKQEAGLFSNQVGPFNNMLPHPTAVLNWLRYRALPVRKYVWFSQ